MYKENEIQKLIDELDIVEVIGEYVVLKKAGVNYKGLSPFKEERTPSFVVSPTKRIFKDFSTNIAGNVINFYMRINNMSFVEAVEELATKYNISITKGKFNKEKQDTNYKYYEIMKEAQKYFSETINNSEEAMKYMEARGFEKEEIKKFGIGFSEDKWNGLLDYLLEKGYKEEELFILGLIRKNENGNVYDYFRNRITFPIYNTNSKIIGFGGRTIEKGDNIPKYLNSPDSPIFKKGNELYGLTEKGQNIRKQNYAILMEGYLDVLTAHKYGFTNAIASLGTAFTNEQAQLLKRYTQNIIIAYDNDEAGENAIIKASNILKRNDFNVACLTLDENVKDPDEYLKVYGRKRFVETIKKSKKIFDYLFDNFTQKININDILGKKEIVNKFKDFFSNVTNKTEINGYIQKLSVELNIDKEVLYEELVKVKNNKNYFFPKKLKTLEMVETKGNKDIKLEKETLLYLMKYNQEKDAKKYCEILKRKNFSSLIYKDLLEILKSINFDINKLDEVEIEYEEKELIRDLKLESETVMSNFDKSYKDIFIGWFKFELKNEKEKLQKSDTKVIKLKKIESELFLIHNIDEIEKMYEDFTEIFI